MGDVEVQDQVDGVRWLVAQGLADPERVGIYGWSYGGYMSAHVRWHGRPRRSRSPSPVRR